MERGNDLDLNYPGYWFEKGGQLIVSVSLPKQSDHVVLFRGVDDSNDGIPIMRKLADKSGVILRVNDAQKSFSNYSAMIELSNGEVTNNTDTIEETVDYSAHGMETYARYGVSLPIPRRYINDFQHNLMPALTLQTALTNAVNRGFEDGREIHSARDLLELPVREISDEERAALPPEKAHEIHTMERDGHTIHVIEDVKFARNSEMPDFEEMEKPDYNFKGKKVGYADFINTALAVGYPERISEAIEQGRAAGSSLLAR